MIHFRSFFCGTSCFIQMIYCLYEHKLSLFKNKTGPDWRADWMQIFLEFDSFFKAIFEHLCCLFPNNCCVFYLTAEDVTLELLLKVLSINWTTMDRPDCIFFLEENKQTKCVWASNRRWTVGILFSVFLKTVFSVL